MNQYRCIVERQSGIVRKLVVVDIFAASIIDAENILESSGYPNDVLKIGTLMKRGTVEPEHITPQLSINADDEFDHQKRLQFNAIN